MSAFAFDGDVHLADPAVQENILGRLRAYGVVFTTLKRAIDTHEHQLILGEYRARKCEIVWRRWQPIYDGLSAEFSTDADTNGVPAKVYRHAWDLMDAMAEFVRTTANTYKKADGSYNNPNSPRDRAAVRLDLYPRRRPLGNQENDEDGLHDFVSATQLGYMPDVRLKVWTLIEAPVFETDLSRALANISQRNTRRTPGMDENARDQARSKTYRLTADFIRAFFPTFGASTTPGNVKSVALKHASKSPSK